MPNDDERIRGIFRRAFDELRANGAAQPATGAHRARRAFWSGPAGTATGAVAAAAVVALLAVALPGQRNAAVKPVVPATSDGTGIPAPEGSDDPTAAATDQPTASVEPTATTPAPTPAPEPTRSVRPSPTPAPTYSPRPSCHSDWAARQKPPGLTVTLTADKTAARPGDVVRFTVTVRNDGPVAIDYQHGNPTSTAKVEGRRGDEWSSSDGLVYTQELRDDQLKPGESRSDTHLWTVRSTACRDDGGSEPTPAGTYIVTAAWNTSEGGWIADPITFTVR